MLGDESFQEIFWLLFPIVFIAFTTDASAINLIQNEIAEENYDNIEGAEPDSRMTDQVVGFPGEIEKVGSGNGREIKTKVISSSLSSEYDDSSELVENDMQRDVAPGKKKNVYRYSPPARINARLNVHQLLEKKRREKPGKGAGEKLSGKESVNHEAAQKKRGSSKGNLVNKAAGRRQTKMRGSRNAHPPSWEGASYRLIRPKNVPPLFGPPPPPPAKPSIIGGLNVPSGSHPPLPGFKHRTAGRKHGPRVFSRVKTFSRHSAVERDKPRRIYPKYDSYENEADSDEYEDYGDDVESRINLSSSPSVLYSQPRDGDSLDSQMNGPIPETLDFNYPIMMVDGSHDGETSPNKNSRKGTFYFVTHYNPKEIPRPKRRFRNKIYLKNKLRQNRGHGLSPHLTRRRIQVVPAKELDSGEMPDGKERYVSKREDEERTTQSESNEPLDYSSKQALEVSPQKLPKLYHINDGSNFMPFKSIPGGYGSLKETPTSLNADTVDIYVPIKSLKSVSREEEIPTDVSSSKNDELIYVEFIPERRTHL